jgi:hypothetical protein
MNNTALQAITEEKVRMYPNPAGESFQISGFDGNAKLVISDFHCRVLFKQDIACDELISLKSIPRGVYIAKIITAKGTERRKLERK